MYKKYSFIALIFFIIFILCRIYLQSEHIRAEYIHNSIQKKISGLEKKKSDLITLLHQSQSPTTIKKEVVDKLSFIPLTLQQIFSLSHNEKAV
jgi:hypothetical protein